MIRNITAVLCAILWGTTLAGQTLVDLRTQSKSVDFGSAQSTRPLKTGSVLPATCVLGEMFFLTTSTPGGNLYGCSSTNTWSQQAGGPGGGGDGAGTVTVLNTGTPVGARGALDLSTGQGIVLAVTDTGQAIAIQSTLDTSVALSRPASQAGGSVFCSPASGSGSAYTCSLSPTLTGYTTGMVLRWRPDVNGSGGATTLNIDSLGARSLKLADGTTNPSAGEIIAGRIQEVWYDGTSFRLLQAPAPGILGETRPSCSAAVRGRVWFQAGGTGVKDELAVCAKDAAEAYQWRTLY